jgi:glucose-6-phosphate isomerase
MSSLDFQFGNVLKSVLGENGIDDGRLVGDLAERFRTAYAKVEARRAGGDMGLFDLPFATESAAQTVDLAEGFGQWFENVVILGIGGSALGARTLRDGLLGPLWNQLDDEARDHFPRLYVLDNVDPSSARSLLEAIDIRRSLFCVISKSGATAETMALYLVVEGRVREVVGEEKSHGHFLFITDPEAGVLRRIAEAEQIPSLPIPSNVGGRFSVLSPVGLLPAAVTGIDVEGLMRGAARMEMACRTDDLLKNPAGLFATLMVAADQELGRSIHVLMPYCDRLRTLASWFQQLWAESLGKALDVEGRAVAIGPTPLPALGATDQHAQVQLFMEGPHDKIVVFVAVGDEGDPVQIPDHRSDEDGLAYLGGRSLRELFECERLATTEALRQAGRPSLTLEAPRLDATTMGALLQFFEIATVFAGALYGVDPLNQPGVELGKRLTYGLMGRDGFEPPTLNQTGPGDRISTPLV